MAAKKPVKQPPPLKNVYETDTLVQAPFRPESRWTVTDIESILTECDAGILQRLGDFCESLYTDYQIQSATKQRVLGLLGLPLVFSGGVDDAILRDTFWKVFPASELVRAWVYALFTGTALIYMRDDERDRASDLWLPRAEAWHPRFYHWDEARQAFRVQVLGGSFFEYVQPGDPNWIILTPYGRVRPWADSLWRALAFAWIIKRFAVFDRSRHSEVLGSPLRVGTAPQGSTQKNRERWQSLLQRLGRDAAFVLPPGYDIKLVEGTGKGEVYENQILWADQAFSKLLTGQPITTDGSNMGFGEGTVFADIKLDFIKFDNRALSEGLGEWFSDWAVANFGERSSFSFNTSPPEDLAATATGIGALGEAIAKADAVLNSAGKRVDSVALYRDAGVPLLDSDTSTSPEIVRYHLEYGIATINEIRQSIGLAPVPDGDRVPVPFMPTEPGKLEDVTGVEPEPTEDDGETPEPTDEKV